ERFHAGDIGEIDPGMQFDRGVRATVDEMADRIRLHRGYSQFPDITKTVQFGAEIDRLLGMLDMRVEESKTPFIGPRRRLEALLRENAGGDAGNGGPAGMHPL